MPTRREQEHHEQMRPRWEHAAVVGQHFGFGPATGLYRSHHWGKRYRYLYLFEGGLALLDPKGRTTDHVAWAEIVSADWTWMSHDSGGSSTTGHRLETATRTIKLNNTYGNADDLYWPVGGMLRALSATIDGILPVYPSLNEALTTAIVQPLAARALLRLDAGETLMFGKTRVDRYGITYGKKIVAWHAVESWETDSGRLKLRPRLATLDLSVIPGGWVLVHILAARCPGPATT
ncbi:hypothetical protein KOI35_25785 [Actinoplanes bogorensis]|uniref:Uncharacterized protein n=1 Tax=Paractinoplanes bogorensis TaxID=1610840 RepID=A0ABS5YTZ5_9ACTN|nr:hypothetical protein [Actinoplanes bogorensis]MBU2666928.1 hypothetical protein [Actinoplanes bogorensis]